MATLSQSQRELLDSPNFATVATLSKDGTPISAAGFGELGATFEMGIRDELEYRKEERQLRDEEGDAAPPRSRIDLDGGTAVLKLPE